MRLWSIHPRYLDQKGLVALWREALLAKAVLEGKTEGYRNHPQLKRFKEFSGTLAAMNTYLEQIHSEAIRRDYSFDESKIGKQKTKKQITVTKGQLEYEFAHLKKKLEKRDPKRYQELLTVKHIHANPLFLAIPGDVEDWERQ